MNWNWTKICNQIKNKPNIIHTTPFWNVTPEVIDAVLLPPRSGCGRKWVSVIFTQFRPDEARGGSPFNQTRNGANWPHRIITIISIVRSASLLRCTGFITAGAVFICRVETLTQKFKKFYVKALRFVFLYFQSRMKKKLKRFLIIFKAVGCSCVNLQIAFKSLQKCCVISEKSTKY